MSPADEMSPRQREAYERECLREFRAWSANDRFHKVLDARLENEYPKTVITVRWRDSRDGQEREKRHHLWISPVTGRPPTIYDPPEGRELPYQVGMLIGVDLMES